MTPYDFDQYVSLVKEKLQLLTDEPVEQKEINYGQQLKVKQAPSSVTLSLYNGKKGLKTVWGGKETPLLHACKAALDEAPEQAESLPENPFHQGCLLQEKPGFDGLWCGSDESGKGDYFGPLAVAAVCVDEATAAKFAAWGVGDSKALTDDKIHQLAAKIRETARAHTTLVLKPQFYNQRYQQLKDRKMNLNHLLASGHIHALGKVLQQVPECHYALVDQFTKHNQITSTLEQAFPGLHVYQQPRAEADMAVAAASILARDAFVGVMAELAEKAGFDLPKGGGAQATAAARRIVKEQGKEALAQFVKLHFANSRQL